METSRRHTWPYDAPPSPPVRQVKGDGGEYARAQALTAPGETVLWAGAPEHAARAVQAAAPDAAAGALLLVAAGALAGILFGGAAAAPHTVPPSPLPLVLLACLSVAGVLLSVAPLVRARNARGTLYVVTDRRVLLCRNGRGRRPADVEPLAPLQLPLPPPGS
jgi:hypothetical protein